MNLIKKALLILLIFFISINRITYSQNVKINDDSSYLFKRSLYIEIGGNTGSYSINYDIIPIEKKLLKISTSIGFFVVPTNTLVIGIPLEVNGLLGNSLHFCEIGIGFTPLYNEGLKDLISARIGYRHQKVNRAFFYRISFTPILKKIDENINSSHIVPWFGFSIGLSLK